MPLPNLSQGLRRLLGRWHLFGETNPPSTPTGASLQVQDGRTAALRLLREYVTDLIFYLPMSPINPHTPVRVQSKAFRILPENFHLEWPDWVNESKYPSAVILGGPNPEYLARGFTPYMDESTHNVHATDTALQVQDEYSEMIQLDVWASKEPELRSMNAGIETAFSPIEGQTGLRMRMPAYFDETVIFTLRRKQVFGDSDASRGARHTSFILEMRFNIVVLVAVEIFRPQVVTNVDVDEDTGLPYVADPTLPNTEAVGPSDAVDAPKPQYPLPPSWT